MKIHRFAAVFLSVFLLIPAGCGAPADPVANSAASARKTDVPPGYQVRFSGETPSSARLIRFLPSAGSAKNGIDTVDEVFLKPEKGWKACRNDAGWTMDLSQTQDGGKTWQIVSRQMKIKDVSGITFRNGKQGYISFGFTPACGWITLNTTEDGGTVWGSLNLTAPEKWKNCFFYTFPPVFFSDRDGLILTHNRSDSEPPLEELAFVTHDGGRTWRAGANRTPDGNLRWDCVKSDGDLSNDEPEDSWRVVFGKQVWCTENGFIWEPGQ